MNWIDQSNTLMQQIYLMAKEKGFWERPKYLEHADELSQAEYYRLKKAEKIALLMSELGEMLEGVRKPGQSDKIPEFTQEEEEAADVFIRLLDYCGGFSIRLFEAVDAKLDYNSARAYRHGKAF